MASKDSPVIVGFLKDATLEKIGMTFSSLTLCGCLVAVVTKLLFFKALPNGWKYCLLCQDVAYCLLSLGLLLVFCHVGGASGNTCKAGGFFIVVGVLDIVSSLAVTAITFLLIQNPAKMSQLSTFRWQIYLSFLIPPKILSVVLAVLPVSSLDYFDADSPYTVACFPVRQEGKKGAAFGAILSFIILSLIVLAVTVSVVLAIRFWAGPGTRVHASTPSLWQTQKIEQGRSLHKFCMVELIVIVVAMFIVTIVVYTNVDNKPTPQWLALLSLAVVPLVHVGIATVHLSMWSGLFCDKTGQKKEPHHRLKQLELIRTEGPGKLRLKVTWAVGKTLWKRGLLKVYGPTHIKAWAQEIVVLGLLRKSRSASVLQCLWTSNTNPYHESMTLISGDIVTNDSRLTCLELTSSGTLQELLKTMEVPLADSCQRVIMRDIAEGLSRLHELNVLHRNLTSAAVYLKGSVQRLVLRAAIGDFEEAQIYGTLLTGSVSGTVTKKQFFFPDIRSYALVGVELLARVCECRRRERQLHCTTSTKTTSSFGDPTGQLGKITLKAEQDKHFATDDQSSNGNGTELVSEANGNQMCAVKRFDDPDFLYCVPGEPEYGINIEETFNVHRNVEDSSANINAENSTTSPTSFKHSDTKAKNDIRHSHSAKSTNSASEEVNEQHHQEHIINNNWKLQAKKIRNGHKNEQTSKGWRHAEEDSKWSEYNVDCDVPDVRKSFSFTFPNYSIFRGLENSMSAEELDMIEEDIDVNQKRRFGFNHGQQSGYVTSVTSDGREIFIPATYALKRSGGNSSSGYGSSSGSTILQIDHYSAAGTVNSSPYKASGSHRKGFQITSPFNVTGSVESGILEVLPAVGDSDSRSRQAFKELKKAKEDARVEQLMASYEARVRKGKPPDAVQSFLDRGVDPRKNFKQGPDLIPDLDIHTSKMSPCYVSQMQEREESATVSKERHNDKLSAPQHEADTLPRQQQSARESNTSDNSSSQQWTAKSSLRRNKARLSLKKAFIQTRFRGSQQLSVYDESRGMKGKEVEQKYSNRQGHSPSKVHELNSAGSNITSNDIPKEITFDSNNGLLSQPNASTGNSKTLHANTNNDCFNDKNNEQTDSLLIPHSSRKFSVKNRPAPQPPPASFTNPDNESPHEVEQFSQFLDSQTRCRLYNGDVSLTSGEHASTESDYTMPNSSHAETSIDQIESDMNDIIQSNLPFGQSNSNVPLGLRLIESGFDSDSTTSDESESCVCAAAALQIPEGGSTAYPSEVFSQNRCSCACSNCLGSIQSPIRESSWPDSPDSESWNNSNSFSSYDNSMHRRKLPPRKRDNEDSAACILAPDDQYPSSVHHTKVQTGSSLHLLRAYSLERRQRSLSQPLEHYPSSVSEASSAVSRHYKELIKKGVPLRVSVISGENSSPTLNTQVEQVHKLNASHATQVIANIAHEGIANIAHEGATDSCGEKSSECRTTFSSEQYIYPSKQARALSQLHSQDPSEEDRGDEDYCHGLSSIPSLEDIIKEIPDETGRFPEEAKSFLNRPDSELSIKAMKEVLSGLGSTSGSRESKHLTEQMIDRIFSHPGLSNKDSFTSSQCELDVNDSTLKEIGAHGARESVLSNADILFSGIDDSHMKYCEAISDGSSLVAVKELFPANAQTFGQLRSKLQQGGSAGLISNQILDLIMTCWLAETPPTTIAIVHQLTDNVTETEL